MVRQVLQREGLELKLEFGDFGIISLDPNKINLLDKNANIMDEKTFNILVKNIEKDKALSQLPLIIFDFESESFVVISGNHRVVASIRAKLTNIPCIIWLKNDLKKDDILRLQLSHNSIRGKDDKIILKELLSEFNEIENLELSGCDEDYIKDLPKVENIKLEGIDLEPKELTFIFDVNSIDKLKRELERLHKDTRASEFNVIVPYSHSEFLKVINETNEKSCIKILTFSLMLPLLSEFCNNYVEHRENGEPLDELGFEGLVNFNIEPIKARIALDTGKYKELKEAVKKLGGWEMALQTLIDISKGEIKKI